MSVETNKIPQEELMTRLPEFDGIIVRSATKVRKDLIEACPKLKFIARGGVGLDNIDVDFAKSKGIPVFNTPAASSASVAELAFAHIFNLSRNLHISNKRMPDEGRENFKKLKKQFSSGIEVRGKNLGIIGIGRIGQEVARIGLGLGMNILPVDPYIKEAQITLELYKSDDIGLTVKIESVPLDYMLERADFVSMHVPFSGGKPIIGVDEIAKMKTGACIINAARGGTVDENALLDALNSGKLRGAGLDVFVGEPTPRQELLDMEQVSLSPHIGASTAEAQRNIGLELADKIIAHLCP
jgi:D-3-phosphoglycerate dehydrogenase